jgi:hypothetical protein
LVAKAASLGKVFQLISPFSGFTLAPVVRVIVPCPSIEQPSEWRRFLFALTISIVIQSNLKITAAAETGLFRFWLRFGSVTGRCGHAPSTKPRQNQTILVFNGHIIF